MSLHKILIANRGEIACRVIRTARALGYRSVAVYSDADAQAPHVALADEAVHLGPAAAAQSYLAVPRIIDAARRSGADAVHPGYGFLSERADFARACIDAGLTFIGPPPEAIAAMGNKALAKRRMLAAGVPCAPGDLGDDQSDAHLTAQAERIGTPLLVKAVSGGGGRGMRLVRDLAELPRALAGARREALSAFGDATLMLERLIERARHIEVQVFADAHGHAVHLGERDCTAQRRRQKVVEEAPSPVVNEAMRARMGEHAVAAALAVGYRGAGTVEFVVDEALNHYFLEMNTRLQVEHPVTECVTGLDLVEWQLRVAAGEPLPLTQAQVRHAGHAIEVRLYAEDPATGFTPDGGTVLHWRPADALRGRGAAGGVGGVRIDDGIREGGVVTPHYDPMVAKLIAHGRDRDDACRRLIAALEDAPLVGVRNNARFLRDLLNHPAFRGSRMHTTLLDEWSEAGAPLMHAPVLSDAGWALAAAALAEPGASARRAIRAPGVAAWNVTLECAGERRAVRVQPGRDGVDVALAAQTLRVTVLDHVDHRLRYALDGVQRQCVAVLQPGDGAELSDTLHLVQDAAVFSVREATPYPARRDAADPGCARAPMAGTVVALQVAAGDSVREGDPLVCIEAMKMELWLHARAAGRVAAVHVQLKDSVAAGSALVDIDLPTEPDLPP